MDLRGADAHRITGDEISKLPKIGYSERSDPNKNLMLAFFMKSYRQLKRDVITKFNVGKMVNKWTTPPCRIHRVASQQIWARTCGRNPN